MMRRFLAVICVCLVPSIAIAQPQQQKVQGRDFGIVGVVLGYFFGQAVHTALHTGTAVATVGRQSVNTGLVVAHRTESVAVGIVGTAVDEVTAAAFAAGVPANIAHAVARQESGYNPNEIGTHGERGVMQVLPQTAAEMGLQPRTMREWIDAGMAYLKRALALPGTLCEKLTAYNEGLNTPRHCSAYGRNVQAMAR
jgi:hypothetical protein